MMYVPLKQWLAKMSCNACATYGVHKRKHVTKMSGKSSRTTTRIELEIEKHREESNWKKILEIAEQLKTRISSGLGKLLTRASSSLPTSDILVAFVVGESKLEQYLEANPPNEQNIPKAKSTLLDARRHLMNVVTEPPREKTTLHQTLVQDSWFLMGKLCYATGAYEEALGCFQKGGLEAVCDRNLANRGLKIVAEAYAIKGLCMEKIPPASTSKYKLAEREEQIVRCFETATDMALLYLQEHDKQQGQTLTTTTTVIATVSGSASPLPGLTETRLGPVLETAIQRAPIMHIKKGDLNRAVSQYRNVLTAVEASGTQTLRMTLARQLAEVLLRGVSERTYKKPEIPLGEGTMTAGTKLVNHLFNLTDSPLKPRRYTGHNLFVPKDENEEILLLLLLCEAMAVRDAVLSRSQDHKDARIHSYNNTTAIYDLLVISLVRRSQFLVLCESFEKSMKFSFEEFHIWFQFGLSLIAANKHGRAILVLKECIRLESNNALPCLLASKICLENLNMIDDGISYALQAFEREKSQTQGLTARCLVAAGFGYMLKSEQTPQKGEKQDLQRKAFESFHKALQSDPNDYLAEFYLAYHFAQTRQIPEAIQHVKIALNLRGEHISSLHLFALLLSAQKQYDEALQLVESAIEEFPDNLNLIYTKAHLEEYCVGGEVALLTAKHMLELWKSKHEDRMSGEVSPTVEIPPDPRGISNFTQRKCQTEIPGKHCRTRCCSGRREPQKPAELINNSSAELEYSTLCLGSFSLHHYIIPPPLHPQT
uniref:Tetratricopeptide repeat protein 7 N-terminal domain-containing protein n=1 Tax=Strigamia maritima TaxID=126957 RepID=T1IQL9_STRMM